MGSACCVPAKSSARSDHGREPGFGDNSPPNWSTWDRKAGELNRVPSSSGRGNTTSGRRFLAGHHRRVASGSLDLSPSGSFRGALNPLSASQICPVPVPSDSGTSPCMTVSSAKEDCLSAELSTPESTRSLSTDFFHAPTPKQPISITASSKTCPGMAGQQQLSSKSRSLRSDYTAVSSVERAASGEETASATFSELVASHWELQCLSPGNSEDFVEVLDPTEVLAREKIRACSSTRTGYVSPTVEPLICGLCSRWLSQKSPLTSHKIIGNIDLPSIGVLSCGHVFHVDCLEQVTSQLEKQDPPCPRCAVSAEGGYTNFLTNSKLSGEPNWELPVFEHKSKSAFFMRPFKNRKPVASSEIR